MQSKTSTLLRSFVSLLELCPKRPKSEKEGKSASFDFLGASENISKSYVMTHHGRGIRHIFFYLLLLTNSHTHTHDILL